MQDVLRRLSDLPTGKLLCSLYTMFVEARREYSAVSNMHSLETLSFRETVLGSRRLPERRYSLEAGPLLHYRSLVDHSGLACKESHTCIFISRRGIS